jgi:membrane associated rhomboid family serine protease
MAGTPRTRSTWNLGTDDPATVLANARKALFVMTGFLAVIWIVQIANWADSYSLTYHYGIQARDAASLPDILTAPFLHVSWAHIEGNSGPLFIFGFLAAYRGIPKFLGVTAVVVLTSGLGAWLTQSAGVTGVGASGAIFGYFGYIIVRGIFDRHAIDLLIGAVMALSFAYQFSVLLPQPGIGYQAHIGGLIGGVASGWIFRDRRARSKAAGGLAGGSPGLTTAPGTGRTGTGRTGTGKTGTGKTVAVDPSRAELHKQLDDLGL